MEFRLLGPVGDLRGRPAGAERLGIALVRQGAGYVLRCEPLRIDLHRLRHLVDRARASGSDPEKMALLREARELWQVRRWRTGWTRSCR